MNLKQFNSVGHTHHDDEAALGWNERRKAIAAAVFASAIIDPKAAAEAVQNLIGDDKEKRAKTIEHLCKAAMSISDSDLGRVNLVTERYKTVTSAVMPMLGTTVQVFTNLADERNLDMQWRQWFGVDALQGGLKGSLFDILNNVVGYELNADTDDIPASDFMSATWAAILPEYKGSRVRVSREILQKDPMTTINGIVVAIRYALEVLKSQLAYTATQAAITAANGAGYTTAYTSSSVVLTVNAARLALFQRNFDRGWSLDGTTPAILVANEAHRGIIEAAFTLTTNTRTESANGTVIVQYPITRVYTYNLAADLGISGSKAALILPARKNRYGIFKDASIESYLRQENNAVVVDGREGYNFITDTQSYQVLTIA